MSLDGRVHVVNLAPAWLHDSDATGDDLVPEGNDIFLCKVFGLTLKLRAVLASPLINCKLFMRVLWVDVEIADGVEHIELTGLCIVI